MFDWISNKPPIGYVYIFCIYTTHTHVYLYVYMYIYVYYILYCPSIYLKFFCARLPCASGIYMKLLQENYKFIIISMHILYKLKQVYLFNSLYIMQLPGTRSKLMTL